MPNHQPIGAVLVDTNLRAMISVEGRLTLPQHESADSAIQPDSLDLYLGTTHQLYKVNGMPDLSKGFDPNFVRECSGGPCQTFPKSGRPVYLEEAKLYLVKLPHQISLLATEQAEGDAKSSVARTDFSVKLIGEGCTQFNVLPAGYKGGLWLAIIPQSFPAHLLPWTSLNQLRIYRGPRKFLDDTQLWLLHKKGQLLCNQEDPFIQNGKLLLRLDLSGKPSNLVSTDCHEPILIQSGANIDPHKYFYEKPLDQHNRLWLEPGQFAIVRTLEIVNTPEFTCATMQAYDPGNGEFRSHYAGFGGRGFRGRYMCEIRNMGLVPLALSHGMFIASLTFEYLLQEPETQFENTDSGKRYLDQQGITLPSWFAPWNK